MAAKVRLKDIAAELGVHPATVSKALSGHPKIPESTRQRIREQAEQMGYKPDPLLSSLSRYRNKSTRDGEIAQGNLAFVTSWPKDSNPVMRWGQRKILPSAEQAAKNAGYQLNSINLAEQGIDGRRLSSMLYSRGVSGVILAESPYFNRLEGVDWERFSFVGIGFGFHEPKLHRVVSNPYESMWIMIEALKQRGHQRPGLILRQWQDARTHYNWTAAYHAASRYFQLPLLEPLQDETFDPGRMNAWLDKVKPDAIIHYTDTRINRMKTLISGSSYKVRYYSLNLDSNSREVGINQNLELVGRKAVDILIAKINRHERGVESDDIITHIGGRWHE